MTSNIGAEQTSARASLGFTENAQRVELDKVREAVRRELRPELINRIDDIIVFSSFGENELLKISEKELEKLRIRAEQLGIEVSFSPAVVTEIARTVDTEKYGARPIKRRVTELIENELAYMIINKSLTNGDKIKVELCNNKISFSKCVAV